MMIHEIKDTIWLDTPKGKAIAKFLIDYGPEADLCWVCIHEATGEIWTWANWDVRACHNISMGREPPARARPDLIPDWLRQDAIPTVG